MPPGVLVSLSWLLHIRVHFKISKLILFFCPYLFCYGGQRYRTRIRGQSEDYWAPISPKSKGNLMIALCEYFKLDVTKIVRDKYDGGGGGVLQNIRDKIQTNQDPTMMLYSLSPKLRIHLAEVLEPVGGSTPLKA